MVLEALLGDGASAVLVDRLAERHDAIVGGALEAAHRRLLHRKVTRRVTPGVTPFY